MEHWGYREADILPHTLAWLRHAIDHHEQEEMSRLRVAGKLMLQSGYLAGVLFNAPEPGQEMFAEMMAKLDGNDAESDDAWLLNPNATTDVAKLSQFLAKKDQERRQ